MIVFRRRVEDFSIFQFGVFKREEKTKFFRETFFFGVLKRLKN